MLQKQCLLFFIILSDKNQKVNVGSIIVEVEPKGHKIQVTFMRTSSYIILTFRIKCCIFKNKSIYNLKEKILSWKKTYERADKKNLYNDVISASDFFRIFTNEIQALQHQ